MFEQEKPQLAQPEDSMFERNIAIIAMKGRELEFILPGGYTVKGFITGIDLGQIQVLRSLDRHYSIVNRLQVLAYAETGKSIENFPDGVREELEKNTEHFTRVARSFYQNSKDYDHAQKAQEEALKREGD